MKQIIKRILREQFDSNYLNRVSNILLQSGPPYFNLMEEHYNITNKNEQLEVMKYIYGNQIYYENSNGQIIDNRNTDERHHNGYYDY
jgi:hypothetical protein